MEERQEYLNLFGYLRSIGIDSAEYIVDCFYQYKWREFRLKWQGHKGRRSAEMFANTELKFLKELSSVLTEEHRQILEHIEAYVRFQRFAKYNIPVNANRAWNIVMMNIRWDLRSDVVIKIISYTSGSNNTQEILRKERRRQILDSYKDIYPEWQGSIDKLFN